MADERVLAAGGVERIGEPQGRSYHRFPDGSDGLAECNRTRPFTDHKEGLQHVFTVLGESETVRDPGELAGIGHRVVHGGETWRAPVLINPEVMSAIRDMTPLAPLHNPPNLLGIEVARDQCPGLPQVAVFDTAFHQTLPPVAYRYAIPRIHYHEDRIRRYGFHGTSHAYVARTAADILKRPVDTLNLITLHLGNGASVAAIERGRCVDTSMGMSPLEGLVMGTRSGDLDPSIVFYLQRHRGMALSDIETLLNRDSGLKGLCGSNDMRAIHRAADDGSADARLAIDVFCYRIRKYLGAYVAVLGHVDAIIFTGGIGEHDARVREQICANLDVLGIRIEPARNAGSFHGSQAVHAPDSPVTVLVVPTDEELEIARQTWACLTARQGL